MTNSFGNKNNCDANNKQDLSPVEMDYDQEFSNSNGNLTLSEHANPNDPNDMNPCLRSFKACCKKKANFGKFCVFLWWACHATFCRCVLSFFI